VAQSYDTGRRVPPAESDPDLGQPQQIVEDFSMDSSAAASRLGSTSSDEGVARVARELVIDLGLLGPEPDPAPAGVRRRRLTGRHRGISALVTVVLVFAAVAGSGAPPARLVSVPVQTSGRFEVVGDLLFVAIVNNQVSNGGEPGLIQSRFDWTAYDLSTGEPLWTLDGVGDRLDLVAVDGLLWDGGFPLDPATGRWLSPEGSSVPDGYRYLGVPGGETLVISGGYRPYSDSAVDIEFTYEVMGVEMTTGLVRWRDQPDPGVRVWLTGDPVRVITISSDELVSVRDLDTGEVIASRRIPGATSAELIGDRLLVWVSEPGGEVLHAYASDTMAPLWKRPEPDRVLDRCGPMLCVHTVSERYGIVFDGMTGNSWEVSRETELIDPATGEPAWVTADWLYPVGDQFLAYGDDGALRALLDAPDGRVLRDLTGWQAVVPPIGRGGDAVPAPRSVTLVRTDPTGTRAARLDPATGQVTDLGQLPAEPVRCQPYPDGVVCLHADRIWVWPL
jgi:hypothetical protein